MSCKKTSTIDSVDLQQNTTDSISFSMNNTLYSFNETYSVGVGNSQINVKPYNEAIAGRTYAYGTAGKLWYGTPDSTMYSSFFGLSSTTKNRGITLEIYFNKKYKISDLTKSTFVMIPEDQSKIFKPGKQPFAIDFEKENTREGVVLTIFGEGKILSSKKPGFSIAMQSHRMDIQDNSSFEILKVDHIKGDDYLMEAVFSLNLFDEQENLYRVEQGFIRKRINMLRNWSPIN